MRLNSWEDSWRLHVKMCPCDVHFADYLRERGIRDRVIFHFGSGEHHLLGVDNAGKEAPDRNEILAVTASRGEYLAYIDLICAQAEMAIHYKVIFADIYTLSHRILPRFDLVTLFHLCEFYDPEKSRYAPLDDTALLDLLLSRLNPEGRLFFYTGSGAFLDSPACATGARGILEDAEARGEIVKLEEYKSLLIYGRPSATS
jgi:hypothetical protein